MGKGSRPRPLSIPLGEFNDRLDTIFGKKAPKERWVPPPLPVLDDKPKDSDKQSK